MLTFGKSYYSNEYIKLIFYNSYSSIIFLTLTLYSYYNYYYYVAYIFNISFNTNYLLFLFLLLYLKQEAYISYFKRSFFYYIYKYNVLSLSCIF